MDRFKLAATELSLIAEMKNLERKLQVLRAEMAKDSILGDPMKWIEVHYMRGTGGCLRIRETRPLYPTPIVDRTLGEPVVRFRDPPVEVTVHLDPAKARRVYETFRGEGASPLYTPANGVAVHAPWSQELEALLRSC